ncbi:unnamed protein product [Phytomonas sp. Hart1]|nr:unnamed protein product [Phytomonas sp. Hart1]|eukprot:CCW67691.1 unnamed protein product [Phytomonas sp. isolate Hart1]
MRSLRPAPYHSLTTHLRCDISFRRTAYFKRLGLNPKLCDTICSDISSGSWPVRALLTTSKGVFTSTLLRQELSKTDSKPGPSASPSPSSLASTISPNLQNEVAEELIEELKLIFIRFPKDTWLPISDIYNEISIKMRKEFVRPHRTLYQVLLKAQSRLQIHLDPTGISCAHGNLPLETPAKKTNPSAEVNKTSPPPTKEPPEEEKKIPQTHPPPLPDPLPATATMNTLMGSLHVDFYYNVGLREIPPPPADFNVTPSSLQKAQSTEDGAVLSLRDFVPFIPPFFVPLDEVLRHIVGYTEEHILSYLNMKAMEMVQIAGEKYIRLYGGYANISLEGCESAEEVFKKYKPKLELLSAFVKAFDGIYDKWMPLKMLLHKADPVAVAQLNPKGPASIVYFAQMQHVFSFSVVGGRSDDAEDELSSSVLLRKQPYTGLTYETTPTPKSLNFILQRVPIEGSLDIHIIQNQLPLSLQKEIDSYYGNLISFFNAHVSNFFLMENNTVVMRTRYRNRMQMASLPLEEQLKIAYNNRDKKKIRSIRRRIAFRDNPSHPFHDPDNLVRELAKYLPHRGFVTLKSFLRTNIPDEILFFMPSKINNFFANYPQYFQHFEYQIPGTWCISRPGQPLPRGVIRQQFSEDDLLRLVGEYVQRNSSPRSCSCIYLNMPHGAQEVIRKRHGGLYYFIKKYPQYFNIVLGSDTGNMKSAAIVHLVSPPPTQNREEAAGESMYELSNSEHNYDEGHSNDNEKFDHDL